MRVPLETCGKIAPSILAADFARIGEQVKEAELAGADRIHVDVMDGHFVAYISMGTPIIASLRAVTPMRLETRLMISHQIHWLMNLLPPVRIRFSST